MLRAIGRIIGVCVSFIAAALVTLFVIVSLGQERIVQAMAGRSVDEAAIGAAFDLLIVAVALFSSYTLLPALLLIIVGEAARIRSALYYVIGAGVALCMAPLLARVADPSSALATPATIWQVFATAGFAGGFVYWLLAGRNA
jgi:hypothetical protein